MHVPRQTMDFYAHQDRARARSRRIVVLYALSVLAVCGAVSAVAAVVVGFASGKEGGPTGEEVALVALATAAITGLIIAGGSLYRIAELRGGGKTVAHALGGRLIDPSTTDPDERRVLNVVEEMAIASGVPVPPVYVMREERGINAFAAGYSTGDAVIGVTRGCVEGLTRDELQGVMAHEFSHILNGDMRLNVRLIGLLYGIVLISLLGHTVLRAAAWSGGGRTRRDNGGGAVIVIFLVALAMLVIGSIGALAARIMQAAVSRQREFLADAAAVQFTRNPEGIRDALRRIGGSSAHARVKHPRAQEAGHLFFGEAAGSSGFAGVLASHPPLKNRIRRIDPSWDGTMLRPRTPDRARDADARTPAPRPEAAALLPLLALAGQATPEHVEHARSLIAAIPEPLRKAAHETASARAVVHALVLDPDDGVRRAQIERLASGDPALARDTRRLGELTRTLRRDLRLPLLDMTLGALAHLSDAQHRAFRADLRALIEMDRSVSLFEWVTLSVLTRHLDERFGDPKPHPTQYYALGQLGEEVGVLLSCLAHAGTDDDEDARRAFDLGAASLKGAEPRFLPRSGCSLGRLDAALTTLRACSAKLRADLLRATALVAGADRTITADEAELVRAVADTLGVPTPPLLPGQTLV